MKTVGDKVFCVASLESPFSCLFKVPDDEVDELSNQNGFAPAYMARAKWVLVNDPSKLTKKECEQNVRQSYELVKSKLTKKLRENRGI